MGVLEERRGQVQTILEWQAEELGCTLLVLAHHGPVALEEVQSLPSCPCQGSQALQVTVRPGLSFPVCEVGVQIPWGQAW